MHKEQGHAAEAVDAQVQRGAGHVEEMDIHGRYVGKCMGPKEEQRAEYCQLLDQIEHLRSKGYSRYADELQARLNAEFELEIKWEAPIENLFTTVGKNDVLDKYFAGSAYTQTVYMGLKGTGTAASGDTQASHATWSEVGSANAPAYSGTRKTPAFSAASAGSKATSAAVSFTFTSGGTVAGCFINNGGSTAIDNTSGVLVSAGDFTGGSKTVSSGDTLSVTYTASV